MAKVIKKSQSLSVEIFSGTVLECIAFSDRLGGVLIDENGFLWELSVEDM